MPTRSVSVRVLWADGTPVGARAYTNPIERPHGFNEGTSAPAGTNLINLKLMQHYSYAISADWFAMTEKGSQHVKSGVTTLPDGKEERVIEIRLNANRPDQPK